jgi:hypothetical protein
MKFTTDKIEPHGYFPTYLRLASQIGTHGRVCEVGISGSSLHMWQALFPNGIIVGVDNNQSLSWPDGTVRVIADQDDEILPRKLLDISESRFDLIIDDASHIGKLSRRTWELLWPIVKPNGWYILEDWMVGLDNYPSFDDSMLKTAQSFLSELNSRNSEVEFIEYRYGLVILHKRGVA